MGSKLDALLDDLVVANRILAHEGVVDGYGHVSLRHPDRPDRFFLACSCSPEQVRREDLIEYDLDCNPVNGETRQQYSERPIHGGIYQTRPDVSVVIHNHAEEVIPFGVAGVPLRPLLHVAGIIGPTVPVWDIHDHFGDTDLLVTKMDQGLDLARHLGSNRAILMRGHGCAVAGQTFDQTVRMAVYMKVNAKLQAEAMRLGEVKFLTPGEVEKTMERMGGPTPKGRIWANWALRCGAHGHDH